MYLLTLLPLFLSLTRANPSHFTPPDACSRLQEAKLTLSHIRFTASITAGSNFTGDSTETSYNAVQTSLPAGCRVAATVQTSHNSSARFEIWFPADGAWNSRFLAVGNGGWAGGINYPDIVTGLKKGKMKFSTWKLMNIDESSDA